MRTFNVAYFTASCDTVEMNTKFAKSLSLDYPILSDPGKKIAEAYGVVTEDREVPFRWTFYIGVDGKIMHIDRGVRPGMHGVDIVEQLSDLGVERRTRKL